MVSMPLLQLFSTGENDFFPLGLQNVKCNYSPDFISRNAQITSYKHTWPHLHTQLSGKTSSNILRTQHLMISVVFVGIIRCLPHSGILKISYIKRGVKPNKSAKQLLLSERSEALILCQEAIIKVPSLCVQGIAGDAIFNCDYVFTFVFCVFHSRWSFVVPSSLPNSWQNQ